MLAAQHVEMPRISPLRDQVHARLDGGFAAALRQQAALHRRDDLGVAQRERLDVRVMRYVTSMRSIFAMPLLGLDSDFLHQADPLVGLALMKPANPRASCRPHRRRCRRSAFSSRRPA